MHSQQMNLSRTRRGLARASSRLLLAACLAGAALLGACTSTQPPAGVEAVSPFDLQRYQGGWYEIARLDHSFERGLNNVTATYTPQSDGSVQVLNRGYSAEKGKWSEAVGKAWFTGAPTTGSLKVSFFGPFYGGYHVVSLDSDYRWALVVGADLDYAWILAREKTLATDTKTALLSRAKALGIDTEALIWVSHDQPGQP